jgi:hypothetical protein
MPQHPWIGPSRKRPLPLRAVARPIFASPSIKQSNIVAPTIRRTAQATAAPLLAGLQPDPYLDYGRYLTPEGGVLIVYKDVDTRLRHTIWRLLAWAIFTGIAAAYLFHHAPHLIQGEKIAVILVIAILNWLIVMKPVQLYRRIEIRPDCMILDGSDIFWRRYLEYGFPNFRPDKDDNQILCGIYGTRFIEYLTLRRFDDYDRAPEVFAAHLQEAMHQLWARPPQ